MPAHEEERALPASSDAASGISSRSNLLCKKRGSAMMPYWMRFTITKKIALPFLLMLLLIAGLGITSLVGHRKEAASLHAMARQLSRQITAAHARSALSCLLMAVNDYLITGRESYHDDYEQCRMKLERHLQELQALASSDEDARRLEEIRSALDNVEPLAETIFLLAGKSGLEMRRYRHRPRYCQAGGRAAWRPDLAQVKSRRRDGFLLHRS